MCVYIYIYITKSWSITFIIVMLLLSNISSYIIHLFFIFSFHYLNFSSPYFPKKKKKKKTLLFPISSHVYCYTSSNLFLSFFLFYFFISLLFYCYISFLFLFIYLFIFLYLNFSSPYFQPKKKNSSSLY